MWTAASKTSMNLAVKDWKLVSPRKAGKSLDVHSLQITRSWIFLHAALHSGLLPTPLFLFLLTLPLALLHTDRNQSRHRARKVHTDVLDLELSQRGQELKTFHQDRKAEGPDKGNKLASTSFKGLGRRVQNPIG